MEDMLANLAVGLPVLLSQFGAALALLVIGIVLYELLTPYREFALIADGNTAAGIALFGAVTAMAIPLAACMANSFSVADVFVWGSVVVVLQLITFLVCRFGFRGMTDRIAAGNVASALKLASFQLAVGLLNAAAMTR